MYFAMFAFKPRSRYVFAAAVVLIFLTQLIAWIIRSTYELYNYNGCSFSMKAKTTCPNDQILWCILPKPEDCDKAKLIVNLFAAAIIYPLVMIIYLVLFTGIYYFCSCNAFGLLRCQQFLWFVCYSVSAALFFLAAANIMSLSEKDKQLNSQVTATSISLGILYVVIVALIIGINHDLNGYLKSVVYQPPPPTQTTIIAQQITTRIELTPQPRDSMMRNMIQQQNLEIQNLRLEMQLQQRDSVIQSQHQVIQSIGQQQYYPPGAIGQPISNLQQDPVQGVQFQEVEIK